MYQRALRPPPGPDAGLRAVLHARLPMVHWQAIEVGLVGRGVPDTNGCHRGREVWIECKRTGAHAVGLEPEQVAWLTRRARAGGHTWVAVRRWHAGGPRIGPPADELWLVRGEHAREVRDVGLLAPVPMQHWAGGPRAWDWPAVLSLLFG